jgi:ABC-type multidrug transport system permease subunit
VDIVRLLLLSSILYLAGGALGICFISFVRDPKVAGMGSLLRVFPQMFLSDVLIPIRHASGLLALLTYIKPMTYSADLARAVFYWAALSIVVLSCTALCLTSWSRLYSLRSSRSLELSYSRTLNSTGRMRRRNVQRFLCRLREAT